MHFLSLTFTAAMSNERYRRSRNNIAVTGGLGFIGHHLLNTLIAQERKVTIIDNLSNPNPNFVKKLGLDSTNSSFFKNKLSFYNEDIRNKETISDILKREKCNVCIHLAAKVSVYDSIINPKDTMDVNVNGIFNVLEACYENGVENFVFASTGAVYGEPKDLPILEDHVLEPLSPYGASKVAGEALISSYMHSGKIKNGLALRFFNVYGEGQTQQYAGVITSFMQRLSNGLPPVIYGDGLQTRDFIFVNDIVRAIIMAADACNEVEGPNAFNIATGKSTSINELARIMIRLYGYDMDPIYEKERKGDIKYALVDVNKAKETLGFASTESVESSLRQLIGKGVIEKSPTGP